MYLHHRSIHHVYSNNQGCCHRQPSWSRARRKNNESEENNIWTLYSLFWMVDRVTQRPEILGRRQKRGLGEKKEKDREREWERERERERERESSQIASAVSRTRIFYSLRQLRRWNEARKEARARNNGVIKWFTFNLAFFSYQRFSPLHWPFFTGSLYHISPCTSAEFIKEIFCSRGRIPRRRQWIKSKLALHLLHWNCKQNCNSRNNQCKV